jgi:Transposase DDE domain
MTIIPQVATALQEVLNTVAATLGRSTGFVQRACKVNGALFVQTLVFTFLANPNATGDELTQTAAALGTELTESGLTQRFTQAAATLLQDVLAAALTRMLVADPLDLALLDQFSAVYLEDSTIVALPDALVDVWRGCGNATDQGLAALKLTLRLDLRTGLIAGLSLHDGCTADQKAAAALTAIGAGALYLADLGFFGLRRLRTLVEQQAFFLSRLHGQTSVFTGDGQRWDDVGVLLTTMGAQTEVDLDVTLGVTERVPARLVAVHAPQEVVDQRRRRLRADAARRGRTVSARQLALAAWTIFITNVPRVQLTIRAVLVLARCRWQIELVFKRWKSHGKLDESRSAKPWRVLCEVYAKLLAMVIQHWVSLISLWGFPDRSLTKALHTVQKYALQLAVRVWSHASTCETLTDIARVLDAGCRMNRRRKAPNTYQLVMEAGEHGLP